MRRLVGICHYVVAGMLLLPLSVHAENEKPVTDSEASYSLGVVMGMRIKSGFPSLDFAEIARGIEDAYKKENASDLATLANLKINQYQQQQDAAVKVTGDKFRAENGKKKGVITTASGLQYEVLTQGKGAQPKATDKVTVHYRGTLLDGKEFDSSYSRNEPATFPLNGVIAGWTEGVQLMKVGSKYRFVIPPEIAYGERGAPPRIGPNETLIFEVELLAVDSPT